MSIQSSSCGAPTSGGVGPAPADALTAATAQTWTLADDFSASTALDPTNPAGVWHFCEGPSFVHDDALYSLLPNFEPNLYETGGRVKAWRGTERWTCISEPFLLPFVSVNTGAETTPTECWEGFPANAVAVHPSASKMAIVGWRSPVAGSIKISGGVVDNDSRAGDGIGWSIDKGTSTRASGEIVNGGSEDFPAGLAISVSVGDFLYFLVDARSSDAAFDTTRLDVTLTYEPPRLLKVKRDGTGTGGVTSSVAGIDCLGLLPDCEQSYDHGTLVALEATADPDSEFVGWSGDCTGSGPCEVTMDAAKTVVATFTLTSVGASCVAPTSGGGGPAPADALTAATAQTWDLADDLSASTALDPVPNPAGAWHFCESLFSDYSLLPKYEPNMFGSGGQVKGWRGTSGPWGCLDEAFFAPLVAVNTGAEIAPRGCWPRLAANAVVVKPSLGGFAVVVGWRSPLAGSIRISGGVADVGTDGDDGIRWWIEKTAPGGGSHALAHDYIEGGGSAAFPSLAASVNVGDFLYFRIDALTTAQNFDWTRLDVTLTYEPPHLLQVKRDGTGTGEVVSAAPGIDCRDVAVPEPDCSESYEHGTVVTLTATPNPGSHFAGWSGPCTETSGATGPCDVTMDAAKTVTATFTVDAQVGGDAVVNTTADHDDGSCLPLSSGDCTLREAILRANAPPAAPNTVSFDIPGGGVKTIAPTSALPTITDPVTIDGYTQPGASPNTDPTSSNAVILIELDGTNAGTGAVGLYLAVGDNTVRGLAVGNFDSAGIESALGDGNHLVGNYLGTNATGGAAGNGIGVLVLGTAANQIGGSAAADRNVISANLSHGLELKAARANTVSGNLIGVDRTGLAALGNGAQGVALHNSSENNVADNTISANETGIVSGGPGGQNRIDNNRVGTNSTATAALGNKTGIWVSSSPGNRIETNIVAGNRQYGVVLIGASTTGSILRGNLIGTNADGTVLANAWDGIRIIGASRSTIGGEGAVVGDRNVIAFNGGENSGAGVTVQSGETNDIIGNSIHSNSREIDLGANGATANDPGDADTGANGLQNFPVLQRASTDLIGGILDSTPETEFRLEFFSSTNCGARAEGETFLAKQTVITDAAGHAAFSIALFGIALGDKISATATGPQGTSEFGPCRIVAEVPRVSIDDVAELEGDEGTKPFRFTVTRSAGAGTSGFHFQTVKGSAQAGSDYLAQSGDRTFADGQTELTIDVLVNGDGVEEPNETFTVELSAANGATILDGTGVGTIRNDDTAVCAPTIRTLSNGDPTTTDGALRIPVDALGAAGDETVGTALYNPPGSLAAKSTLFYGGLYASNKDEFLADCLSATSAIVSESASSLTTSAQVGALGLVLTQSVVGPAADGSSSLTQRYVFTNASSASQPLVLAHLFDGDVGFLNSRFKDGMVATADGSELKILDTADPTVANPYVAASGDLDGDGTPDAFTGQPYDYRSTVVQHDGIHPDDAGRIFADDDGDGRADSEADFSGTRESHLTLAPGQTKTLTVVLTFGLEPANRAPVAANDEYTTDEGTPLDVSPPGVLANDTDLDGDALTAVHVDGPDNGTLTLNPDGSFLYTPNAGFNGTDTFVYRANDGKASSNLAVVTIRVRPRLEVIGITRDEGTGGLTPFDFLVRLTGPTSEAVAVDFATAPGSAVAGADFQNRTGTLAFAPGGPLAQTVTVLVVADALDEFDEEFFLRLLIPRGALLLSNQATGLIRDDDGPALLEIGDVTVVEGHSGTKPAQFKVGLDVPSGKAVTVPWSTQDGTALTSNLDYQAASGTVTFAPGETLKTLTVNVIGNTVFEPHEIFYVNLGVVDNATIVDAQGVGTIRNDDSGVVVPPPPPVAANCDHPGAIKGTEGNDPKLEGTAGDDIICGGAGIDTIYGYGGNDLIFGGRHIDQIYGGPGNDTLRGEGDSDTLRGEAGNDVLEGGSDGDVFYPGAGDDQANDGGGVDTLQYSTAPGPINVDLRAASATGEGTDTLVGKFEIIRGSPHADKLMGDDLPNDLWGGDGPDEIHGLGGNDDAFGGKGNDELYAGAGTNNALLGGDGSDFCQLAPGRGYTDSCERGEAARAARGAAAPVSFASTFTAPNQVKSKTVRVSPSTSSVQIFASWEDPAASFGVTVELVDRSGKVAARGLAGSGKGRSRKPVRLRLKTTRGASYLVVEAQTPAKLRAGKKPLRLRVKLRAKGVSGPTTVSTTIVQKRHR